VAIRGVYLDSVNNNPIVRDHIQWLADRGAQLRASPVLPIRMTIFDGHTAVVPIDPKEPSDLMVIRSQGVLAVLIEHFEQTWESAGALAESPDPDEDTGDQLNATEQAALKMLARGLTDEAVARRLDVSLRTVRRTTARIMKILDTRSRFEAGVRAAKRGWV
jgi:DNA-binding CsgD family transcriptional regulator